MLKIIPNQRISTSDALNHEYFDDVGDIIKHIYI